MRAAFRASKRTYYTTNFSARESAKTMRRRGPWDEELERFRDIYDGRAPLELVCVGVVYPYVAASYSIATITQRRDDTRDMTEDDFGDAPCVWRWFVRPLHALMCELPFAAFQVWVVVLLACAFSLFTDVPSDPRAQVCLDYACSMDIATWLPHMTWEIYVPVDLVGPFGRWYEEHTRAHFVVRHALVNLRYVYGTDVAFAGNASRASGNFVCVGVTTYHPPTFRSFRAQVETLARGIQQAFPDRVRFHPGKLDPPCAAPCAADVRLVERLDPHGVFRASPYSRRHHRLRRVPPLCCWVLLPLAGTAAALLVAFA